MAQNEYTSNRTYRHLTREKLAQIEVLLQLKLPKSRIAREVGIARSTLYNELARGTVQQLGRNPEPYTRYFGDSGQHVYEHRRRNGHCPIRLPKAKTFVSFAVKQILTKHPTPDTICGLAREKGCFTEMVCSKTLYNYIEQSGLKNCSENSRADFRPIEVLACLQKRSSLISSVNMGISIVSSTKRPPLTYGNSARSSYLLYFSCKLSVFTFAHFKNTFHISTLQFRFQSLYAPYPSSLPFSSDPLKRNLSFFKIQPISRLV